MTAPHRIGTYEVIAPLGAGGMGEVFRARDPRLGREVALKVLPATFAQDPDRLARFRREAHVLASLNHPNIGSIYGLEEADGLIALALELVEGEDLADRLKRGPLPVEEAITVARQIAEALEEAHEKGVVHRDLKPANVKVAPDGRVKVLDFGLAKALLGDSHASAPELSHSPTLTSPTHAGIILGTAAYMSPEQARGKPVDRRADIWSFGVVLFEMLSGRRLFAGETVSDTLAAVLKTEPDWTALPAETPAAVRQLLRRCLERDPRRRLRDIGEARVVLEAPGAAPVSTPAGGPSRRAVWGERMAWAALAVVLSVAVGWLAMRPRGQTLAAVPAINASLLLPENVQVELEGTVAGVVAVSPDGTRVAFGARTGDARPQIWVRTLADAQPRAVPGTEGGSRPFWSPDGRTIGFFADAHLKRADAEGGPVTTLARARAVDARGGTWSRAGTIVYAPTFDGPLFAVPARGGEARQVTTLDAARDEITHRYPHFLPDGRHFVYLARSSRSGSGSEPALVLGSVDSTERKMLVRSASNAVYADGHLLFADESSLMAQAFDGERLELVGDARPVIDGLLGNRRFSFSVFSAAGPVLAYQTGRQNDLSQLTWFDRSGKRLGVLGAPGMHTGAGGLALSDDGRRCVVPRADPQTGQGDLWVYDLERGTSTQLPGAETDDSEPIFTADGRSLVYAAFRGRDIKVVSRPTGGGAERALFETDADTWPDTVSPDGKWLVLGTRTRGGGYGLQLMPLDGSARPSPMVGIPATDARFGQISPDGRYIAYSSDETGRSEVHVSAFPGPGARWQVSREGGTEPRWRGDGKEIFYFGADNTLHAVEVVADGDGLSFGTVQKLFQARDDANWRYAVTRDGQRFLVRVPLAEQAISPITILTQWTKAARR